VYGLNAITAQNGWAMAFAGALIVFSGLVVLALAIAQLHKLLNLIEKKASGAADDLDAIIAETEAAAGPFGDVSVLSGVYGSLASELGETFQLSELFALAQAKDLPHPHFSIKTLREGLYLMPQGDGVFKWEANDE
jgi:hypothetical protein